MNAEKPLYQSRTFWVNALVIVIATLTFLLDHELIKQNAHLIQIGTVVVGVLNLLLRTITTQPVRILILFLAMGLMVSQSEAQVRYRQVCDPVHGCRWVPVQPVFNAPVIRRVAPAPVIITHQPVQIPLINSEVISPSLDLEVKAAEALAIGDRQFIRTVRQATTEARKEGKLSAFQQARILAAIRLPRVGKEVEQMMAAEFELPVSATGLIDWENFDPEKFLALVEAIIKILLMFGIGA